jgi:hypothetical protein
LRCQSNKVILTWTIRMSRGWFPAGYDMTENLKIQNSKICCQKKV